MSTIPEIAAALRLILGPKADEIAQGNGFMRRRDKRLTGARFVQMLLTMLTTPNPSLTAYCHTAAALGLPLSAQAVDQNFTAAAAHLLLAVLQQLARVTVTAADPLAAGLLTRFRAVYVFDSSCIGLPARLAQWWTGCGNGSRPQAGTVATLKLALGVELLRGSVVGFELLDGVVHDRLAAVQHTPLPAQGLRLADLGFFSLTRFAAVGAQAGWWFSRLQTGVAIFTPDGRRVELEDLLAAPAADAYDAWLELSVTARLPARLMAARVTQAVADNRRRKLRAAAMRKGQPLSKRRLASAGWNVYVSNISAEQLSVQEAVVLAGVRWQIELLFKLWKSHGRIADWAESANPWRVLSEVYAKMMAMLVTHWLLVVSCWANPARSLRAGAAVVRQYAGGIVSSWTAEQHLISALTLIQRVISLTCHMTKRKKCPSTYQLLLNPDLLANVGVLA
jgi:hypothetical protein